MKGKERNGKNYHDSPKIVAHGQTSLLPLRMVVAPLGLAVHPLITDPVEARRINHKGSDMINCDHCPQDVDQSLLPILGNLIWYLMATRRFYKP